MVAVHLGVVDEEQIDNMTCVFFDGVLEQLGRKLSYDAVVNYAGNSFCEKSWDMIMDANPMFAGGAHHANQTLKSIAGFFEQNGTRTLENGEVKLPGKGFNGRDKRGV